MKTVFKIGFLLVAVLGYGAWAVWCYNEFGTEMTPYCLGSWAFMVLCKLVIGVFIYGAWDQFFADHEYGVPRYRNTPPPPNKRPRTIEELEKFHEEMKRNGRHHNGGIGSNYPPRITPISKKKYTKYLY